MNRMIGIIFAAIVALAAMVINPNQAHAVGEEFTCDPTKVQVFNFIECGKCGGCPPSADLGEIRVRGEINQEALIKLSTRLNRARSALSAKADKSVVEAIERRVAELEKHLQVSCASIDDVAKSAPCWGVVDKATGQTNMTALGVIGNALQRGVPFEGTVAVGATSLTPGFYGRFVVPVAAEPPAFAQSRRDTPRPVAELEPLGFLGPVLGGCVLGGVGGWGLADGFNVDFDEDTLDDGNEGKGFALGCLAGGVSGALFTWGYNRSITPDD